MLKIFNAEQIKEIDKCTIECQNITSVDLMEKAALAIHQLLKTQLHHQRPIFIFAGPGNNGGDALALARMLLLDKFLIKVLLVNPQSKLSDECAINKGRLENLIPIETINTPKDIPQIPSGSIVIDGLFGEGINRPTEGLFKQVIQKINESNSNVYSIDMPSGLFVENNDLNPLDGIVKATEVLTFGYPKLSLLLPENNLFCQKMTIIDIGLCRKCIEETSTSSYYLTTKYIAKIVKKRPKFAHKGNFGHVMLICGSYGKAGSAVLASKACLKTGVGLLTTHVPKSVINILQTTVPEAMVSTANTSELYISDLPADIEKYTVGVGPGIGVAEETKEIIADLFSSSFQPIVLDADALNIISQNELLKNSIPKGSILTPHPIEFERLAGQKFKSGYDRLKFAKEFTDKYEVFLVLKGAYSAIVCPDGNVYFNSTGNPGMATAGSGDALTGIITSLLAQKYSPKESAIVGTFLHGMAGDIAAQENGEEGIIASDIINYIGRAFLTIRNTELYTTDY